MLILSRCLQKVRENVGTHIYTHRSALCQETGTDRRRGEKPCGEAETRTNVSASQATPGQAASTESAERKWGPAGTLIADLQPQGCERINLCCLKAAGLWFFVAAAPGASHRASESGAPLWVPHPKALGSGSC